LFISYLPIYFPLFLPFQGNETLPSFHYLMVLFPWQKLNLWFPPLSGTEGWGSFSCSSSHRFPHLTCLSAEEISPHSQLPKTRAPFFRRLPSWYFPLGARPQSFSPPGMASPSPKCHPLEPVSPGESLRRDGLRAPLLPFAPVTRTRSFSAPPPRELTPPVWGWEFCILSPPSHPPFLHLSPMGGDPFFKTTLLLKEENLQHPYHLLTCTPKGDGPSKSF